MRTIKTIILISIFSILITMVAFALNENDATVIFKSISTLEKVQSKLKTIKGGSDISRIIDLATKQLTTAVSNPGTSCASKLKTSLLKLDQVSNIIVSRSCANSKRKICIQNDLADELLGDFQEAIDDLKEITVLDTDNNKIPDICDEDPDGDRIAGRNDNCPLINNPDQIDTDKNGTGDVCELFYCCQDSSLTVPLEECERKTIDSCNKEGGIVLGGIPPVQKRDTKKRAQSLAPIPDVGEGVCVANCPSDTPTMTYCPNNCSSHGFCSSSLMGCSCDVGYTGSDCSINLITSCPNSCSNNGFCTIDGECICDFGWAGNDCSITSEEFISMLQDVVSMSTVPGMTYVSTTYDCDDFASDLEKELESQGYDATFTVWWRDNGMIGHAITDVHTTAGEIIFIEPQNGTIIDLDENGDGKIDFIEGIHGMASVPTEGMTHIEVYTDLNEAITAGAPID